MSPGMKMQKIGILADDLTGALDTGAQFSKKGFTTTVFFDAIAVQKLCNSDVLVINTYSRLCDSTEAYKRVKEASEILKHIGIQMIYKKIDSVMRGNVGAEIDAVMDVFEMKAACVVPVFPAVGRVMVDGRLLLKGTLLEKSEIALDILSPVSESHVPTLLRRQSRHKIGHVPLEEVCKGPENLRAVLGNRCSNGDEILVVDAIIQNHLHTIVKAVNRLDFPVLMVGSAGIAGELTEFFNSVSQSNSKSTVLCDSGILTICGSVSPTSIEQLNYAGHFPNSYSLTISVEDILVKNGRENLLQTMADEVSGLLKQGRDVFINVGSDSSKKPGRYSSKRKSRLGTLFENSIAIKKFLGRLANRILSKCNVSSLILIGGDTTLEICKSLNASRGILMDEIVPGMPISYLADGPYSGTPIITKSGSFGGEDVLIQAICFLRSAGNYEIQK